MFAPRRISPRNYTWDSSHQACSHFLRRFHPQYTQGARHLLFHQFSESEQKRALLIVRLGENVMLVIGIVERLRQLKAYLVTKAGSCASIAASPA